MAKKILCGGGLMERHPNQATTLHGHNYERQAN
nr:MAG TPA: hypothetical protein [Caudoviricetes sp.]